jgi:O-methyltransferase
MAPERSLHWYDSFQGLPQPQGEDASIYGPGWMSVSQERFHENSRKVGIDPPAGEHKGWFEDTVPDLLPQRIAFAFVDTDLETSTAHVLPHMYERLVPGGICMFGLYTDDTVLARPHTPTPFLSPGVERAVEAFLRDKPEKACVLYANENTNGYFRKQ